jgi:hypothetical protein
MLTDSSLLACSWGRGWQVEVPGTRDHLSIDEMKIQAQVRHDSIDRALMRPAIHESNVVKRRDLHSSWLASCK